MIFARSPRVLAQNNRIVGRLASAGVALRSDVRRNGKMMAQHEKMMARHEEWLAEVEDKLNGLIDIVDKFVRRNGKSQ